MSGWTYTKLKWRAQLLLLLGLKDAAQGVFSEMLQHRPGDVYALSSRAHLRAQAGDRAGALADYACITDSPQARATEWFNQGFLQEADGQLEAAEHSFRQALSLDDRLDRAWFGLGLLLARQDRLDDAITALERNTDLQPMSPHGWYELARIHERRHEPEKVAWIIQHLQGFEPQVAARLAHETGVRARAPAT